MNTDPLSNLINTNYYYFDFILGIAISSFIGLLIISFLVSACETAFLASNPALIEKDCEDKKRGAKLLYKLIHNPNRFLASIQIVNTLIAFINGAIASVIFRDNFISHFPRSYLTKTWFNILTTIFITLLTAYFQVVFGELVPKRVGMKWPEKIARILTPFVIIFYYLFYPLVWLLIGSTSLFSRIFGVKPKDAVRIISEDDIKVMVEAGAKSGDIETKEQELINNVFEFSDTLVSDIMHHRPEIVAFDKEISKEELFKKLSTLTYSRYPIYDESIDKIIGILHFKDLLKFFLSKDKNKKFDLLKLIHKPYFVFEGQKISEVFQEMQKKRVHFAVVIDEYGGTGGIITLEDLIEEVLGDISDEYDNDSLTIKELKNGKYQVSGQVLLSDLNQRISDIELPENDYDTLSGFMISQINHLPSDDEVVSIKFNDYLFKAMAIKNMIIKKVLISKIASDESKKSEN